MSKSKNQARIIQFLRISNEPAVFEEIEHAKVFANANNGFAQFPSFTNNRHHAVMECTFCCVMQTPCQDSILSLCTQSPLRSRQKEKPSQFAAD